jgi:hypothetical protein
MQLVYVLTKSNKATVFTEHHKTREARNLVDQSSTEFGKIGNKNILGNKTNGVTFHA